MLTRPTRRAARRVLDSIPEAVTDHMSGVEMPRSPGVAKLPAPHCFHGQTGMIRSAVHEARPQHTLRTWAIRVARAHALRRMLDRIDAWIVDHPDDPRRTDAETLRANALRQFEVLIEAIQPRPGYRGSRKESRLEKSPGGSFNRPSAPETPTRAKPLVRPGNPADRRSEGSLSPYPPAPEDPGTRVRPFRTGKTGTPR